MAGRFFGRLNNGSLVSTNTNATGQYGTTVFTVSSVVGQAAYNRIVDAVTAASLSGGGAVYIFPGSYSESITWPSGISVIGATTGASASTVSITGNQVFNGVNSIAFQNIFFNTQTTFMINPTSGSSSYIEFTNCSVTSSSPSQPAISMMPTAPLAAIKLTSCSISGAMGISATGNSLVTITASQLSSTGSGSAAIFLDNTASLNCTSSIVKATVGVGNCIYLNNSGVKVSSTSCSYTTGGAVFLYNSNGNVTSINDQFNASGAYFAQATGSYGVLTYAYGVVVSGTASIDPRLTINKPAEIPSKGTLPWSTVSSNQLMISNNGYIVTGGLLVLTLPSASAVGDIIVVTLDSIGGSWTITQGAGQQILLGTFQTTMGSSGSLSSTADGDSVTLVCTIANTRWSSYATQGNITVN